MRFVINVFVCSIAIWVTDLLFDGIWITGTNDTTANKLLAYLVIGAIIAVVNTFIKPIVKLIALPFVILTLGFLTLIINAGLLELVAWLSKATPLTLHIDEFWWTAIWAALILTIVQMILNSILPDDIKD
ncbi:phage holin family protein [Angustibacter sp. McL0619]|uniref:phage holin family protein n=1 Tax=Angustibacter sp. McL0619 TaxID=3415676 RepID=UPI003CF97003